MTDQDNDDVKGSGAEHVSKGPGAASSRRRLLKVLAGAGGVFATGAFLPERWTRPVVNRVLVPAHAQATGIVAGSFGGGGGAIGGPGPTHRKGLGRRLLDLMIPSAKAGSSYLDCYSEFGFYAEEKISYLNVCLVVDGENLSIEIYPCGRDTETASNIALAADNSFGPTPVGPFTVRGELSPGGGLIDVTGVDPWTSDSATWAISVAPGGCLGAPGCRDCYEDIAPD